MLKLFFNCLVGFLLCVTAMPLLAADRIELAPSSPWIVDYDDDSCALQRHFGGDESPTFLEFRAFWPDDYFDLVVASSATNRRRRHAPETVFEPDTHSFRNTDALHITLSNGYEGFVYAFSFRTVEMLEAEHLNDDDNLTVFTPELRAEREEGVMALRVERGFSDTLVMQTGSMHAPMEALRSCLDELQTHWGIDVEAHKTLSRPLMPLNVQEYARQIQRNYPQHLASRNTPGRLRVRMNVSPEGLPTACSIQNEISDVAFEEIACALMMENARYLPALDAQSRPIASYHIFQIYYLLWQTLR